MEYDSYQDDDADTRGSHTPALPLEAISLGPPPSETPPLSHPTINTRTNTDLCIIDTIAFASTNLDELYYHQAMKDPDAKKFNRACVEEVRSHHENGHWAVVPRFKIPSGTKIVPSVRAMKRKRRIATREIYKWKARFDVHGGKQEYFVYYWETYSPVVQWTSIRMVLILSVVLTWESDGQSTDAPVNVSEGSSVYVSMMTSRSSRS